MQVYGDYVLLVGMTEIQKKVNAAIVSSNFSEILSYFDGSEQSRAKYSAKLTQMLADLNAVATHPFLLLPHMQPNLASKRAANLVEDASGKFEALVALCRHFTRPEQHVAIVCKAGIMTDLVEVLLSERGMNVRRYSLAGPKSYKREAKAKGAQFHLLPAHIGDLSEAAYVAFDVMLLLEEQFDVASDYGRGLRLQLRDPATRHPYAPVLRLVTSNTVEQLQLDRALAFGDMLATAVVLRTQAGVLPVDFKRLHQQHFSALESFFVNPDTAPPLPPIPRVAQASRLDVERTLYLDDADQYQVNFSAHAKPPSESGSEPEPEVHEVQIKAEEPPPRKRRRVELEAGTHQLLAELDTAEPLAFNLLVELNALLAQRRAHQEEVSSHRQAATEREAVIDSLREELGVQVAAKCTFEKQAGDAAARAEKFRLRNQAVEQELADTQQWWESIREKLALSADEGARLGVLTQRVLELEEDNKRLTADVANERTRYAVLQRTAQASAEYADGLAKETEKLKQELADLRAQTLDAPAARQRSVTAQLAAKDQDIKLLRAEMDNLRESIKVQFSQDRGRSGRTTDRRTGRGRGRAAAEV